MRVGFFGQSGPYAPVALRYLVSAAQAFSIVLCVEGRKTPLRGRDNRLFDPGPGLLPTGDDLRGLAVAAGIPTLVTADVNGFGAVRVMERYALDWIVCVGFDRLFAPVVLSCAKMGAINAHPSRLPQWRGPSPLFWAVKTGVRDTAVSLHAIDTKEDHGPIYAQESFIVPRRSSGEQIYNLAGQLAGRMLAPVLEQASRKELVGVSQDHARATRAPRPKPEDVQIDPGHFTCERLVDFACAAPYFRTPFLRLGDETFFVRRGLAAEPGRTLPAQYLLHGTTLIVQCQDGLAHLDLQT